MRVILLAVMFLCYEAYGKEENYVKPEKNGFEFPLADFYAERDLDEKAKAIIKPKLYYHFNDDVRLKFQVELDEKEVVDGVSLSFRWKF